MAEYRYEGVPLNDENDPEQKIRRVVHALIQERDNLRDLGRDLYEAAKDAPARIQADPQYGACYGPEDLGKGVRTVERLKAALARYEREVGP